MRPCSAPTPPPCTPTCPPPPQQAWELAFPQHSPNWPWFYFSISHPKWIDSELSSHAVPLNIFSYHRRSTTWVLLTGQPILKQRLPRHIQPRANTHGSAANVNNGLKKLQQTLVVFGAQVKSQVSGESLGYWQLLVFLTRGPGTHMVGPRVSDENQHINTAGCDGTFKGEWPGVHH